MLLETLAPSTANQIFHLVMLLDRDWTVPLRGKINWAEDLPGQAARQNQVFRPL